MAKTVLITPRDPLIFRDGRPFDSSLTTRLHVHSWPFPSVTAGALRTHAGKQWGYSEKGRLNGIDIRGPLLYHDDGTGGKLYVPAPRDAVLDQQDNHSTLHALRPGILSDGEGTDLPFAMQPLLLPEAVRKPKGDSEYAWWPLSLVTRWLINPARVDAENLAKECLKELPLDERTHVAIDPTTGAADPMKLFSTRGIDFMHEEAKKQQGCVTFSHQLLQLALRVDRSEDIEFAGPIPLGAERRIAMLSDEENVPENLWNYPKDFRETLASSQLIRLQLATPAIFNKGWYPDWLTASNRNSRLTGEIPHSNGVKVELIAAAVGRHVPVSGYAYSEGRPRIKATKKMVPAGSVYFFEVLNQGNAAALAELWLRPICGQSYFHPQPDKTRTDLGADGFGLALWGIWQPNN